MVELIFIDLFIRELRESEGNIFSLYKYMKYKGKKWNFDDFFLRENTGGSPQ